MEALMGPFYGLLCATDPYMELCPHVCYFRKIVDNEMPIYDYTVEPVHSYIVYGRFLAIVELNLIPFVFISLLFYR